MITMEQIDYLLKLSKKVEHKGSLEDEIKFSTAVPVQCSFTLIAPDENEFSFQYDINQSGKNHFKLSLFLMHNDEKTGLMRIDYNGQHLNPEEITKNLPNKFHQYAGKLFKYNEPHIHYNVNGYKNLVWAIPLENHSFTIKTLNNQNDVIDAILEFNNLINLETKFLIGSRFLV